jgi:hypothetical protein
MKNHGYRAAVQNGPAAPELAADAYECIMVRSSEDRPNIRLWRANQRSQRELASDFVVVWSRGL